ncbi:NAD(P)-dependent alcohol dehydrogenase [Arthrobacter sp. Hz1]
MRTGGRHITAKPRNLGFEEAATLVFGGTTARGFLNRVPINPGDSVLVNGASGSVGTAAVQLAKHSGARITAVCSGANATLVRSLGADRVIYYTRHDFTAEGIKYDVVVDCAGTACFERAEGSLKPGGALLLVTSSLKGMMLASVRSRRSGKLITASAAFTADNLAFVVHLAKTGRYRPVIDRTYDLADAVEAPP